PSHSIIGPSSALRRSGPRRPAGFIPHSHRGSWVDISPLDGQALTDPGRVMPPAPSHRPARPWQVALRTAWLVVAALVAAVGMSAAFQWPGPLVRLVV